MKIPCYMFDYAARLRPAAFFDIAQELAAEDSERLGCADKDLLPHGMVWILARMKVVYDRLPVRDDEVQSRTWHRGMNGLFFTRDYSMTFADGTSAVRGTSAWIIMDIKSRSIIRPDALDGIIPKKPSSDIAAMDCGCTRLSIPQGTEMTEVDSHKVVYSDLDYNGHANNAKYPVWSLDALPAETLSEPVKELEINYKRESRSGDTVRMFCGCSDGKHYVEGVVNGEKSFLCTIKI